MLNECSSEPANRVVTLTDRIDRSAAVTEPSVTVRKGGSRTALYLAHIGSLSQEIPAAPVPERAEKTIWSSALDFVMEGFANCGASMYPPMAYFNAAGLMLDGEAPLREALAAKERRPALSLVPTRKAGDGNQAANGLTLASQTLVEGPNLSHPGLSNRSSASRVLADKGLSDRVLVDQVLADRALPESDAPPLQKFEQQDRWSWLRSCWEVVVSLRAHMRREREIRGAIDALAELNDAELADIGIHHRSQIEYAVRNGE